MISLNIKDFNEYGDKLDDDYPELVIYVLRENNRMLYSGMSKKGIWQRWFSLSPKSHIYSGMGGVNGNTMIGQYVVANAPQSGKWIIDLHSIEDVLKYFSIEYFVEKNDSGEIVYKVPNEPISRFRIATIPYAEELLITHLSPEYNIMGNSFNNRDRLKNAEKYMDFIKTNS